MNFEGIEGLDFDEETYARYLREEGFYAPSSSEEDEATYETPQGEMDVYNNPDGSTYIEIKLQNRSVVRYRELTKEDLMKVPIKLASHVEKYYLY